MGSAAYAAGRQEASPSAGASAAPSPVAKKPAIRANELGRIPILMYHSVGDPPLTGKLAHFNKLGLSIPSSLFRKHLDTLYSGGFYPVNVHDIFDPHFSVPAGKIPVALTFDDARISQFRCRKDGSIDPNCAIGILEAFHKKHPDWPQRATFYVLPDSQYNPPPFGQKPLVKMKLNFLVDKGYEVANHTTSHRPLSKLDARTIVWEMSNCAAYVHKFAPKATMDTMALPYGIAPRKTLLPLLLDDPSGRNAYHDKCVLLAAGNPSYAPVDRRFDKLAVTRIGSEPGNIERWIKILSSERAFSTAGTFHPYVSDGDPGTLTIPAALAKYLDRKRLEDGIQVIAYGDKAAIKPVATTAGIPAKSRGGTATHEPVAAAAHRS